MLHFDLIDSDTTSQIQKVLSISPIREPLLRSTIRGLKLPLNSQGLDIGSGIGLQTMLLADAIGLEGQVTGLERKPEMLAFGEELSRSKGYANRVSFRKGDLCCLPFDPDSFDWVWSANNIDYPVEEVINSLNNLIRIIRPGGCVFILAWTSQQILPGYPALEAHLNASNRFVPERSPERHFLRSLRWFRAAGLEDVRAQTYVGNVQAPLDSSQRTAMTSLFDILWGKNEPGVSHQIREEFHRLCNPCSDDFILDQPGYYAFFTYTLFRGRVSRKKGKVNIGSPN